MGGRANSDEPFDINEYRNWTQEQRQAFLMLNQERMNELRGWWLQLMMASPVNLQEKMTLFWHGISAEERRFDRVSLLGR